MAEVGAEQLEAHLVVLEAFDDHVAGVEDHSDVVRIEVGDEPMCQSGGGGDVSHMHFDTGLDFVLVRQPRDFLEVPQGLVEEFSVGT